MVISIKLAHEPWRSSWLVASAREPAFPAVGVGMSRVFTEKLFNRPLTPDHWAFPELKTWASLDTAEFETASKRAMGANLEADWRVSPERQRTWESIALSPAHMRIPLAARIHAVRRDQNHLTSPPDFLKRPNRGNYVPEIFGSTNLVHIFRFESFHRAAVAAALPASNPLVSASDINSVSGSDIESQLKTLFPPTRAVTKVQGMPQQEWLPRRDFLQRFFAELAPLNSGSTPSAQWHGIWVGLWDEFEPHFNLGPADWLHAFGVRPPVSNMLCMVMRYAASHVRPLVRPATIDAGWYPDHFPNPAPGCQWVNPHRYPPLGGHPVHLGNGSQTLLQEFIHRDRRRSADWVVGWAWLPEGEPAGSLPGARAAHYQLLESNYIGVKHWLPEPI